jgi:hypothetical protein
MASSTVPTKVAIEQRFQQQGVSQRAARARTEPGRPEQEEKSGHARPQASHGGRPPAAVHAPILALTGEKCPAGSRLRGFPTPVPNVVYRNSHHMKHRAINPSASNARSSL